MAAAIAQATSVEPTLVEGSGGIFDVAVDGRLLFSKHDRGRFPDPQEILDAIKAG